MSTESVLGKTAIITGAGSGVGRATAVALSGMGWRLVLVGRRQEALEETATLCHRPADTLWIAACDVGNATAVEELGKRVEAEWGGAYALINAAGTNVPQRALEVLSQADYEAMFATNLHGAYYFTRFRRG